MEAKKLYPMKFIPLASKKPWGGTALISLLGKKFVECGEDGSETPLTLQDVIGESWELADMGKQDSVVANGFLAGNTISELMDTYMEEIVGDGCFNHYGRQFPLLIKYLDINDKLSVQVHPDDEVAFERFDSLGKSEMWYVMDSKPGSVIYMGFKRKVSAQEFYDRCKAGTAQEVMNAIHPEKGDVFYIKAGTIHAADAGVLIAEVQESSDITFRLYDWGREFNPLTARPTHLDEALDVINYEEYDTSAHIKAAQTAPASLVRDLVISPEFNSSEIFLDSPVKVDIEANGSFIVYMCLDGEASVQYEGDGGDAENVIVGKGETVLVPAAMKTVILVPMKDGTRLLAATVRREGELDSYTGEVISGEDDAEDAQ